jgi:FkbM family methyltransferase
MNIETSYDIVNIANHSLLFSTSGKHVFNRQSVYIDYGACIAFFTGRLMNRVRGKFILYEPNNKLYSSLVNNLGCLPNVKIINKALDINNGTKTFYIGKTKKNSSLYESHRYLTGEKQEVETITLEDSISEYDFVDFVKMDIEGSEIDVILNTSKDVLSKIGQLSVEYHQTANIKNYTKDKIDRCEEHLKSSGFTKLVSKERDNLFVNRSVLESH